MGIEYYDESEGPHIVFEQLPGTSTSQ
jgi:hypothetical protein